MIALIVVRNKRYGNIVPRIFHIHTYTHTYIET
jgi:hypothetical protein